MLRCAKFKMKKLTLNKTQATPKINSTSLFKSQPLLQMLNMKRKMIQYQMRRNLIKNFSISKLSCTRVKEWLVKEREY